uniref:Uncharacterized protein n=1 Tax=Anguilla anguilla TaxID=7936 RepID=A0A0E9XYU3_ANGAN
MCMWVCGILLL